MTDPTPQITSEFANLPRDQPVALDGSSIASAQSVQKSDLCIWAFLSEIGKDAPACVAVQHKKALQPLQLQIGQSPLRWQFYALAILWAGNFAKAVETAAIKQVSLRTAAAGRGPRIQ